MQYNYNYRKLNDRLEFLTERKTQEIIDLEVLKYQQLVDKYSHVYELQLRFAEITDKVKYENSKEGCKTAVELKSELVTGRVQVAILKKESALAIRYIYKKILRIMKKVIL